MNISCHCLMGVENRKLHTYITMMGGTLRMTGVWVAIWVMLVTRAGAQAGDNLQAPDGTAGPFQAIDGIRRFINGPTSTSIDTNTRVLSRTSYKGLESIGGRVEDDQSGRKWLVNGHAYDLNDDSGTRGRARPVSNGHTGGVQGMWRGEATMEGPHHPFAPYPTSQGPDGVEQEQVSGTGGGQGGDESPGSYLNGPAENKSSAVPEVDSAVDWSRDSSQWMYQEGEWVVVRLPDSAYPSLPTPPPPAAALVVATSKKVEAERKISNLANVTLHYRFYLSQNKNPETRPELKVYYVVDGTRTLLQTDTEQGEWHSRTLDVPQANVSSILFEGWLRGGADVIALSDVDTGGITLSNDEFLDVDEDLILTTGLPKATQTLTSTPATEGNQTQDSLGAEDVSPSTDMEGQDNTTAAAVPPAATQVDPSLNSTTNTSQSPAEGEVAASNVTETPTNSSVLEASIDNPENKTQTTELINGSVDDIVTLNSSTRAGDNTTLDDHGSDFSNSTTTTDVEESDTDEEVLMTTTTADDEASPSEPEVSTEENTNNSTDLLIPGVDTDALPTNTSVPLTIASTTSSTSITTGNPGYSNTPSRIPTRTRFTNESQDVSKNVFGGDELVTGMTPVAPQTNLTSGNVTSSSGVMISLESTALPSAGNSTEAVSAVPESSTSWQVFQVFLVLCAMGLLALGFLYWKRKRRQDDEIPVFTRDTDYHNPTFSMEDAASFMSRSSRNTYKTIE